MPYCVVVKAYINMCVFIYILVFESAKYLDYLRSLPRFYNYYSSPGDLPLKFQAPLQPNSRVNVCMHPTTLYVMSVQSGSFLRPQAALTAAPRLPIDHSQPCATAFAVCTVCT